MSDKIEVNSSNISYLSRRKDGTVIVEFKRRPTGYTIKGLPDQVWQQWLQAASKGKFFANNVKNAGYVIEPLAANQPEDSVQP